MVLRMMSGRVTYANALSTLALFVALGGASYAAVTIPPNSVGSPQLRANAVTLSKLGVALGSNSAFNQGPETINGFSCSSTPSTVSPLCPPPQAVKLLAATVTTKQRGNLLVIGTVILGNPASSGPAVNVELSAKVDREGSFAVPVSFTGLSPGEQQTGTTVGMFPRVPAGHHVVELWGRGGPASASEIQVTAVAVPGSP